MRPVASSVAVPVGLVHGGAQATVKLPAPASGAIGSLNAAVMIVLFVGTPVVPSRGATAVTVGGAEITGGGGEGGAAGKPRIASRPAPPPHALNATARIAASHGRMLWNFFMGAFGDSGAARGHAPLVVLARECAMALVASVRYRSQGTLGAQAHRHADVEAPSCSADGVRYAPPAPKENPMLYTIAIVLILLWALGLVTSVTMGGLIHVLLVVAIVVVLLRVISGRRAL
jgi:hypothetical protein